MDKLSGLTSKLGGGSSGSKSHSSSDNRDFVDKGLDAIEKKFGGGKVDPNSSKTRATNEKITDTARQKFESMTGL
ncbi:hypothetical protein FE257_007456 [Aspergillus nanangensis]|uniref:Uncharacterized protein n=1 Tax=Aspergillus nanangensis TaxID=2582783 RepID=A0AAD4GU59_ASPNN|nr:hypothetical protein FE257_007456 [Aspergillus nanangensis]